MILRIFGSDRNSQTDFEGPLSKKYNIVKQEFLQHPHILKATASHSVPPWGGQIEGVRPEGAREQQWQMRILAVDEDFLDTYEIELISGRNLSGELASDATEAFILNETAVKRLNWADPVGKQFEWSGRKGTVIGVVKDFHIRTLHEKIEPFVICMWRPKLNYLSLKIRTDDLPATMAFLKAKWKQLLPHRPFDGWFMDESFDWVYRAEEKFGQIFGIFSLLAIFVACLGLFGLASFTAEQRTKEIGIRKVLGASAPGILLLLLRDFSGLVLVAQLIAWPTAYYLSDQWLQSFAYRVDLGPGTFLLGGFLALAIALGTVGYQVIKAATANPVEALRYE